MNIILKSKQNISVIKYYIYSYFSPVELKPVTDKIIFPIQVPRIKSMNTAIFRIPYYCQFFRHILANVNYD